MSAEFKRRIIVIDDSLAIHADFQKILDNQTARAGDELSAMADAIFGESSSAAPVKKRLLYHLSTATQGQEGLNLVEAAYRAGDPFHLAFVDIRMPPGWDGIETIERLWKVDPFLQTVICSAYSDYSWDDVYAQGLGDSDRLLLLKKPFDNAEIAQLAAALTEKYRLAGLARFRIEELDRLVEERTRELQRTNQQLLNEVKQRASVEERLRHDVLHDRLTGLPNRAMLNDRIEQCVRRRKRDPKYQYALLFLDMDNFKLINDSLGHDAGDKLLIGIGERLGGAVRSVDFTGRICDDVTSRLGGDEFVILLDGLQDGQDALRVAQRIAAVMEAPFNLNGRDVVASLSVGVALGRGDYECASDVLRDADTAVYRAKNAGKHQVAVFDSEMHSEVKERLELETDLRKAISTEQFILMYQPVVSLTTGEVEGFEALVRWRHPVHGMTPPSRFIPVAEATGLIVPIGAEILGLACRQIKAWRETFADYPAYRNLWIAVNISGKQVNYPGLAGQIEEIVESVGLDRSALQLEITEDVLVQQGDAGVKTLEELRKRGFGLALDDFGTGYSSLSYLHRMPVNAIKVDQSFIRRLDAEGRPYSATVQAIVDLAHNCGMKVVGEGVETLEQLVQLQTLDCDLAQGYWFSRPVMGADAQELLLQNMDTSLWRSYIQEMARKSHVEQAMATR